MPKHGLAAAHRLPVKRSRTHRAKMRQQRSKVVQINVLVVVQVSGNTESAGTVVRHPSQAPRGTGLSVRVAGGRFGAESTGGPDATNA